MAQKRTMGQKILYLFAFSAVVFLLASLLSVYSKGENQVIVSDLVAISVAMLVIAVVLTFRRRNDEIIQDERTLRIVRAASTYSWQLTYLLIAVLILAVQFNLANIPVIPALSVVIFFMVFSQLLLRTYFSQKGDVE